jgi:epoxyqueuosine reductase
MRINKKIVGFLSDKKIDFVKFVDISVLPVDTRRGFLNAILIGSTLSKNYLRKLSVDQDVDRSEFSQNEASMDRLAERLADYLVSQGHKAYAQSEKNLINDRLIEASTFTSILPHKTIALLAGLGWIGKDNLLVTREYGSGFCMCTVLTDAPIISENKARMTPQCGTCDVCETICPGKAISGKNWDLGCKRERLVDIKLCIQCLKCLAQCIWTQQYIQSS